jgi:hypothetical protein
LIKRGKRAAEDLQEGNDLVYKILMLTPSTNILLKWPHADYIETYFTLGTSVENVDEM